MHYHVGINTFPLHTVVENTVLFAYIVNTHSWLINSVEPRRKGIPSHWAASTREEFSLLGYNSLESRENGEMFRRNL
jgi:hypothetical protein